MVGRTFLMLALFASAMLSGCVGDDDPVQEVSTETSATDDAPSPPTVEADADVSSGPDDDAPQELRREPFGYEGSISHMVGACVTSLCHFDGYGDWDVARDVSGITGASLSLTWDDSLTRYLAFGIARSCDGTCDFVEVEAGTSPVRIDASDLDPDHTYRVLAYPLYRCAPGPVFCAAGYQYSVETPFTVGGLVTVV